jgi:hypothetical protein
MKPPAANAGMRAALGLSTLAFLIVAARGGEAPTPSAMSPKAHLKIVETKTLWSAEGKKLGAGAARFSPDGKRLAWAVNGPDEGGSQLMIAETATGKVAVLWKAEAKGSIGEPVWGPQGDLAACLKLVEDGKPRRALVISKGGAEPAQPLAGADGAVCVAWRADGKALALATESGLFLLDLGKDKPDKLLDAPAERAAQSGAAYEDLIFCGSAVAARAAGSARWMLREPGGKTVDLGECRGLAPDPERGRLYLVPWLAGPVKIPRGAGLAWVSLTEEPPVRHAVVPGEPAKGGGAYWLVDIWTCEYPSTLRVSKDGKVLTFVGVKAGVLAENAWRELCIWQVGADGAEPPKPAVAMGSMFKRCDVGEGYCLGWRYAIESACLLGDLAGARAWRLPKDIQVQRSNTDVRIGEMLIGAARGNDVVLMKLEEEKGE